MTEREIEYDKDMQMDKELVLIVDIIFGIFLPGKFGLFLPCKFGLFLPGKFGLFLPPTPSYPTTDAEIEMGKELVLGLATKRGL